MPDLNLSNQHRHQCGFKSERDKYLYYLVGALLTVLVVKYSGPLLGIENFYLGDASLYFEPLCRYIGEALAHGRFPLWNPLSYCGTPQIAIPSPGLFYPFSWLYGILPFSSALTFQLIAHQLICAVGMFFLLESFGVSLFAAATGALIASLNGYFFSLTTNYTLVLTAAWIPLVLVAFRSLTGNFDASNARTFLRASIFVCLMLLAGRPEIFAPFLALLMVIVVLEFFLNHRLAQLMFRIGVLIAGSLLASPMLLPLFEWYRLSPRAAGLRSAEILTWSANWYDFLNMFLPQSLGDLSSSNSPFLRMVTSHAGFIPYVASTYVGAVCLPMMIYAFCASKPKARIYCCLLLAALIVICLGQNTPFSFVFALPGFNALRYPVKLTCLPIFCSAAFASVGVDHVLARRIDEGALKATSWCAILLTILSIVLTLFPGAVCILFFGANHENFEFGIETIGISMLFWLSIIGIFVVATQLFIKHRLSARVYKVFSMLCTLFPLLIATALFPSHFTDSNFYDHKSSLAQSLLEQPVLDEPAPNKKGTLNSRTLATYVTLRTAPSSYNYGRPGSPPNDLANFHQYNRELLVPNTHMDAGVPSSHGYETAETNAYRQIYLQGMRSISSYRFKEDKDGQGFSRFCALTSTRNVLKLDLDVGPGGLFKTSELPSSSFDLVRTDRDLNVRLYRSKLFMPRVYFATDCRRYLKMEEVVAAMLDADVDFPGKVTFIQNLQTNENFVHDLNDKVAIVEDEPEYLECKVSCGHDAVVVLTDQNYPGWCAYVDGKSVPLLTANGMQRAVRVTGGNHKLELRFIPASLLLGLVASFSAMLLLAGAYIVLHRKEKFESRESVQKVDFNDSLADAEPVEVKPFIYKEESVEEGNPP